MTEPQLTAGGLTPAAPSFPVLLDEGGHLSISTSLTVSSPPSKPRQTVALIHRELQRYGNSLPDPMLAGHHDLADTLWDMADEKLPRCVFLSSLDPGMGKSTALVAFIKHLLSSPDHKDVAVLVCLSRLSEVTDFRDKLSGVSQHVAALAAQDHPMTDPSDKISEARVLLTTQQKVTHTCRGGSFTEAGVFHYKGRPRTVRIWDESFLFADSGTLSTDDLLGIIGPYRTRLPDLAEKLETLVDQMKEKKDGVFAVPGLQGVHIRTALDGVAAEGSEAHKRTVDRLLQLCGKTVPLRKANQGPVHLLDIRETIPSDFLPVVVTDASGDVRTTYDLMERERGNLVRLTSPSKDYAQLIVGVWDRGGGKSAFNQDGEQLLQGIRATIMERPEEDWLIVHHKTLHIGPFEKELRAILPEEVQDHLGFLHWGDHHGTNAFADFGNVILAGTFFLPQTAYEVLARGAMGAGSTDRLRSTTVKHIEKGETDHAILQAICRARVRKTRDGTCHPCYAYIIAAPRHGIRDRLPRLFPGCRVVDWEPIPKRLKGRVKEAVEAVEWLRPGGVDSFLPYADVMSELEMSVRSNRSNFRRNICRHPAFQQFLSEHGLEEATVGGRKGIQPGTSAFTGDDLDL